jgi:hypothetical protein
MGFATSSDMRPIWSLYPSKRLNLMNLKREGCAPGRAEEAA